jgi:hypothetical protein
MRKRPGTAESLFAQSGTAEARDSSDPVRTADTELSILECLPQVSFRKLGFIQYNGELEVHSSLLNVVLHD